MSKHAKLTALILMASLIAACGGGGGGGGGVSSGPYDLDQVIFGETDVPRTFTLSGTDNFGDNWEIVFTRETRSGLGLYCFSSETSVRQDATLTRLSGGGIASATSASEECWTRDTSFLLLNFVASQVDAGTIDFSNIVTGAGIPPSSMLGNGGTAAEYLLYEDNGDGDFETTDDTQVGTSTTAWKLEQQGGRAALVITFTERNLSGDLLFTERDTYFITPDGQITGIAVRVTFNSGTLAGLTIDVST